MTPMLRGATRVRPSAIAIGDFGAADLGLLRQERLAEQITESGKPLFLVWRAPRALIIGRKDARLPSFVQAAERLLVKGWPVLIRRSGGGACPVSKGTLQIALARPVHAGLTIDVAFDELSGLIRATLASYGLAAATGERPDSFCPGRHDLSLGDRKIAGLSQHWRRCNGHPSVTTAATLILDEDPEALAHIVNLFYESAGGPQRCRASAVGSVRQALLESVPRGTLMKDFCNRLAMVLQERSIAPQASRGAV